MVSDLAIVKSMLGAGSQLETKYQSRDPSRQRLGHTGYYALPLLSRPRPTEPK